MDQGYLWTSQITVYTVVYSLSTSNNKAFQEEMVYFCCFSTVCLHWNDILSPLKQPFFENSFLKGASPQCSGFRFHVNWKKLIVFFYTFVIPCTEYPDGQREILHHYGLFGTEQCCVRGMCCKALYNLSLEKWILFLFKVYINEKIKVTKWYH